MEVEVSFPFDKTRSNRTKLVEKLIFFHKLDKLIKKEAFNMKDKEKNKQKEVLNGKSLKKGDKKLNGPNRPST